MNNTPVIFEELTTQNGYSVGIATLNSPRSLNALNHEMVTLLSDKLSTWEFDPNIACVYLQGTGEKAFCAGGDVREVYQRIHAGSQESLNQARQFISDEYSLDLQIYNYSKPIICCGDGIVMGGGLGLLAASSHRIVTDTSRLAMPEIKIGLYPDVGATYFLGKLPNRLGLYIGLTSCLMNASDALHIDIADYALEHNSLEAVFDCLMALPFCSDSKSNHTLIRTMLKEAHNTDIMPESNLIKHQNTIAKAVSHNELSDICKEITGNVSSEDNWLKQNGETLAYGSPSSARLIFKQMTLDPQLTREKVLSFEEKLSMYCFESGDFTEGVRALLIDKDFTPKWNAPTRESVLTDDQNLF